MPKQDQVSMVRIPLRDKGFRANQSYNVAEVTCPAIFRRPHLVAKNLGVFSWEEHSICYQYVWATVDNCLYTWEIASSDDPTRLNPAHQCSQLDQLDQAITAVHLMRAKDGVFSKKSAHIVVVATTVDIILFQVERDPASRKLQLTPTDFFTSSDHVSMTKIVSSNDGRIFMSGADGYLYELEYRKTTFWDNVNGNCNDVTCAKTRVGRYDYFLELLPPFVGALLVGRRDIVDMCYDDVDDAIFVLMMDGATVRRISLKGTTAEQSVSALNTSRGGGSYKGGATPRVPRAMYLLDREHPFRSGDANYKLAVVMHDGDIVYVQMNKSTKALSVGTAPAKNRQTSTLGVMVALAFNDKQTTIIATTKPADGPLNRLQFVTALPQKSDSSGSRSRTLNHVITDEALDERPTSLLGKIYHIASAETFDAAVVEKLYWKFKPGAKTRRNDTPAPGAGRWRDCLAYIQYCSNGRIQMDYCPDPLLRVETPQYLIVGENRIQMIKMVRLLDERIELDNVGDSTEINNFIRKLLHGSKTHHSTKRDAARSYICMLLIILCCTEDGHKRSSTWAHLRDLFTHDLFRSEDGWNAEHKEFTHDQFEKAVQIFIAQVLYRIASVPFRCFTDRGLADGQPGRVPEKVLADLIRTLEKLLELISHPDMFELRNSQPPASDFSFREKYPDILQLLNYLIQIFKFLQVANEAGHTQDGSVGTAAESSGAERSFLASAEAFFGNKVIDLLASKNTVITNCKTAILATVADFSRKKLRRKVEKLQHDLVQVVGPTSRYFRETSSRRSFGQAAILEPVIKESDFVLKVATTFSGSDMDQVFRLAHERMDFGFNSLREYCEKLYNRPAASYPGSNSVPGAGSNELRIRVAKEMLSAAKHKDGAAEFHNYVKEKLFALAETETRDNKEVFVRILRYAEEQKEGHFRNFLQDHVYRPLFRNTQDESCARTWILQKHETCPQCTKGLQCSLRDFAWSEQELNFYLRQVESSKVDSELGESDPTKEPLLLQFCKLPTRNLQRRITDQKEAAQLLEKCARSDRSANISVVARIQCLNTALGRLQDLGNIKGVAGLQTKLRADIEVAKIQYDLEQGRARSQPSANYLLPPGDVYRLAAQCNRPFEKLRVVAAEGRQNPKVRLFPC